MFYGHYRSSQSTVSGCPKEFLTEAKTAMSFPPQLAYHCDLCNDTHGFRLSHTYQVSTPSQETHLEEYCSSNKIERGVEVPSGR